MSAPEPADWLAAGDAPFRTPEGTLRAFQTAAAGEAADLGYRCLSSDFRRRHDLGQLAFRELFERYPWLRYLSRAEVLERRALAEDRIEFLCEIHVLFRTTRIRIGFVREDYFDLYRGDEPVGGDYVPFDRLARASDGPRGTPGLALWVPLTEGVAADEVTEVRAGREWKVDLLELEPDAPPATP